MHRDPPLPPATRWQALWNVAYAAELCELECQVRGESLPEVKLNETIV